MNDENIPFNNQKGIFFIAKKKISDLIRKRVIHDMSVY